MNISSVQLLFRLSASRLATISLVSVRKPPQSLRSPPPALSCLPLRSNPAQCGSKSSARSRPSRIIQSPHNLLWLLKKSRFSSASDLHRPRVLQGHTLATRWPLSSKVVLAAGQPRSLRVPVLRPPYCTHTIAIALALAVALRSRPLQETKTPVTESISLFASPQQGELTDAHAETATSRYTDALASRSASPCCPHLVRD